MKIKAGMEKKCLDCAESIKGRSDKKFCSDHCRNSFNNRLNANSSNLVRNVNNSLRRNHRILQELNPDEKAKVSRTKLLEKGFNFNYFTSLTKTKNKQTYHFCYDQGYLPLENDLFLLVAKKDKKIH
jgi:dipeptidase